MPRFVLFCRNKATAGIQMPGASSRLFLKRTRVSRSAAGLELKQMCRFRKGVAVAKKIARLLATEFSRNAHEPC